MFRPQTPRGKIHWHEGHRSPRENLRRSGSRAYIKALAKKSAFYLEGNVEQGTTLRAKQAGSLEKTGSAESP